MTFFRRFLNRRFFFSSFNHDANFNQFFTTTSWLRYPHNNTMIKRYSQQNIKGVLKPPPIGLKKKRQCRRNKVIEEGTVEKTGFWNVVAATTAEEYDLERAYKALNENERYQPSELFLQLYESDVEFNFVHMIAKSKIDNENREIFIFREGSVVAWNVSDAEVKSILQFMNDFELNKYDKAIVHDEIEVMPYTYSINSKHSLLQNGNICLTQEEGKCPLDKYTFSNVMILSVKLGVWETLLDKYIESLAPLTQDLKLGKPILLSRKNVLKKTGELYALKHSINLSSDLLDVPDFYWEREELETLYLRTCRYFNIPRRTKVINEKLNHCIELVDLLSSHLSDRHHIRLEWMIIVLIMVEVGFEIIHYMQIIL